MERDQIVVQLYSIYSTPPTGMEACKFISLVASALLAVSAPADGARISGDWSYSRDGRLNYLTKFGVKKGHQVFAYGNSARREPNRHFAYDETLVLAFVPSSTWESFYHLERNPRHDCQQFMAGPFNGSLSPDDRCYERGNHTADLYRVVPCDFQSECRNQHQTPVVPGSNFTFRITSPSTQFYFVFLVGCNQNSNASHPCTWFPSSHSSIHFNIHIVSQDPQSSLDPFIYEFSYQLIGMMIVYIIFSCIYFSVLFFHLLMHSCLCTPRRYKHHRLTHIFTVSLALETLHVLLVMTHYCVFSEDGVGVVTLLYLGQALNFISDWLLILVLILIGKGWQITTATVRWKKITLVVWIVYIVVSAIFFSWILVQELVFPFSAEQEDYYQTWAGGLYMAYRLLLLLYILWEMRQIYLIENRRFKLVLYRALIALYILWFCYLPVAVVIASQLNVLERARVVGVSILTFDLVVNLVMVLLMCPKWSQQYFQFTSHLNVLSRVSMRKVHGQYCSVSNPFSHDDYH